MKMFRALGLLALAAPTLATAQAFQPGRSVQDNNPQPVKLLCWDGTAYVACTFSGGGGGGGGDASAANQVTLNNRVGDVTTPATGSINFRLGQINTTLGTPFQAGGAIANTAFGITGALPTGTNSIGSVTVPALADVTGVGTVALATVSAAYTITVANGAGTAGFVVTGLTGSGAVLTPEATNDGTNWVAISGVQAGNGLSLTTLTTDGQFRLNASGRRGLRLRVTTAGTGTATAASTLSTAGWDAPVPARDANGDLRVPTVAVSTWTVSIAANTSTELLAASTTRNGYTIQCNGAAVVAVSNTHATLTSSAGGSAGISVRIPATADAQYIPLYASAAGVTGYATATTICWGDSYARQ